MAANIRRIPILTHSPLHRVFTSLMSDEIQPVHILVKLNLDAVQGDDFKQSVLYADQERIFIQRLDCHRLHEVVFAGAAQTKQEGKWCKKYNCAGKLYMGKPGRGQSFLIDTETREFYTDCTDSPLPSLWWRQAMSDANEITEDLVGDRNLGSEIVRRTVDTLSKGMRRLPNICPECGASVTRSDYGSQLATCPTHGQLDYGGDMVFAIGRFKEAFGLD
jgi:hypothetical protein